jgi:predicted RecB family nuclease
MPPRLSRYCRGMGLLVIALAAPSLTADEPVGYVPIGRPAAVHAALQIQLKAVRDWLDEKDFASAAETTRGLTVLAHLYGYQSTDADWRKRCTALQETSTKLAAAAQRKSKADSDKLVTDLTRLLEDLEKNPPPDNARGGAKDFKPQGGVKTWMVLVDSAHVEAKSAKSAKDFQLLTQAVAAEANAMAFLHKEASWQKESLAVRDLALQAAEQAKGDDLTAARTALKTMRQRCETCHDRTRK